MSRARRDPSRGRTTSRVVVARLELTPVVGPSNARDVFLFLHKIQPTCTDLGTTFAKIGIYVALVVKRPSITI